MKKIINQPESLVLEMCNGIVSAHPGLELIQQYKIIKKKVIDKSKVSLISGGGSGHEPAHAGFVGDGMLDAAVCGDVFASPSQIQVYQAIRAASGNKGTLLIIKNYSGDMMNFQNAAYLAEMDGFSVDYVKVDDDIAVEDSLYTVGRRGVAGTVFVHKIAGAAASLGQSLPEVKAAAEKTAANVRSLGFAMTSCTVPAKGSPTFSLEDDEIEFGVGIHGEPGVRREKLGSADDMARRLVNSILGELSIENGSEKEIAVLVNGFGATPLQELYLLANAVMREISAREIRVAKLLVGNFMTSIDMAGASLSILKLDEELKHLLSVNCDTPALKISGSVPEALYSPLDTGASAKEASYTVETDPAYANIRGNRVTLNNMIYLIDKMSEIIIRSEEYFCELDSHAGDGDFGMSIAKGFRQLKNEWPDILEIKTDIGGFLDACALVIMEYCGGASGPIWGYAFKTAAKKSAGKRELDAAGFADLMQAAVDGIQAAGERSFGRGAVVGDKTLIDALIPCAESLAQSAAQGDDMETAFKKAAAAAVEGAKATERIVARMGRAGTVGERSIGFPDAGAHALGVIFTELAESCRFDR